MSRKQADGSPAPTAAHGRSFAFYLGLLLLMFAGSAAAAVVYVQIQTAQNAEHGARADAAFAAGAAAKQLGSDVAVLKASVDQLAANPSVAQAVAHPSGCS